MSEKKKTFANYVAEEFRAFADALDSADVSLDSPVVLSRALARPNMKGMPYDEYKEYTRFTENFSNMRHAFNTMEKGHLDAKKWLEATKEEA